MLVFISETNCDIFIALAESIDLKMLVTSALTKKNDFKA